MRLNKKISALICFWIFCISLASAEDLKTKNTNELFYKANELYSKGQYQGAIDNYKAILNAGDVSANLYYNIGNSYLKLGKAAKAIFYYEKARMISPSDGDLKSNLDYAKSLLEEGQQGDTLLLMSIAKAPLKAFDINFAATLMLAIYFVICGLVALTILNRPLGRKIRILTLVLLAAFFVGAVSFGFKFYDEVIVKRGIIIEKDVECKYEPIERSTTYYRLPEGANVRVLGQNREWLKIESIDGRVGWVKNKAIEVI